MTPPIQLSIPGTEPTEPTKPRRVSTSARVTIGAHVGHTDSLVRTPESEARARDAALDALEERRAVLIRIARTVADRIAREHGTVTAPAVLRTMAESGVDLSGIDPRWIGVVFRRGWVRVGWTPTGSHARPVAVWKLPEAVQP